MFTSKLATDLSLLSTSMSAGTLIAAGPSELLSSTLGLGHTVSFEVTYSASQAMSLVDVASFLVEPTDPKCPLIIDEGKVQQRNTPLDIGPHATRFVDSDYTTVASDQVILGSDTLTVTLIPAADFAYRVLRVVNIGSGTVTVDPDGSETISGAATASLTQWGSLLIFSTGSSWVTIPNFPNEVFSEFPTVTDGLPTVTLANTDVYSVRVYLNGTRQKDPDDYSVILSTGVITFTFNLNNNSSLVDIVSVDYSY